MVAEGRGLGRSEPRVKELLRGSEGDFTISVGRKEWIRMMVEALKETIHKLFLGEPLLSEGASFL